jgi:hypothetical protein
MPLRSAASEKPAYLGKEKRSPGGTASVRLTPDRRAAARRHIGRSALRLSRERAMIEAGLWVPSWWLCSGTPILQTGQYAPRDRVSRKPTKLRRSAITVSGIIEPPHCVHLIARCPLSVHKAIPRYDRT